MAYETVKCLVELNSEIEEVDARLIPHVKNAVLGESTKIVVSSTDTDILVLLRIPFGSNDRSIEPICNCR